VFDVNELLKAGAGDPQPRAFVMISARASRIRRFRFGGAALLVAIAVLGSWRGGSFLASVDDQHHVPIHPVGSSAELVVASGGSLNLIDVATGNSRPIDSEVPTATAIEQDPSWSRDGRRAYYAALYGPDSAFGIDVWSIDRDGSRPEKITESSAPPGGGAEDLQEVDPQEGPTYTAYVRAVRHGSEILGTRGDIYVVPSHDSGSESRVTRSKALESGLSWSPTGTLAFSAPDRSSALRLFTAALDGSTWSVTPLHVAGSDPAWSPDGSRLAFIRAGHVFVLDVSSGRSHPIATSVGAESPRWSDDGRWIVFSQPAGSSLATGFEILKIPATGGTVTKVAGPFTDFHGFDIRGSFPDSAPSPEQSTSSGSEWKPVGGGAIKTGGYVFSDLQLRLAKQNDETSTKDRAVLRGQIGFVDGYPGNRVCTWTVVDGSGKAIGSVTSEFLAMGESVGTIKDRIDVDGKPEDIEIDCSKKRLDNPHGHFDISAVSVEKIGRDDFEVHFSYEWIGGGEPTAQRCHVTVYADDGSVLEQSSRGFLTSRHAWKSYFQARNIDGDPTDATVTCRALS
jgi:hypothetical protein